MALHPGRRLSRVMHSAVACVLVISLVATAGVTERQEKKTPDGSAKASKGDASFADGFADSGKAPIPSTRLVQALVCQLSTTVLSGSQAGTLKRRRRANAFTNGS